jgi:hypothetical protein
MGTLDRKLHVFRRRRPTASPPTTVVDVANGSADFSSLIAIPTG